MKPQPAPHVPGRTPADRLSNSRAATKSEAEAIAARTIAELNERCDGPNQFDNFDRAFRKSLTVSKAAVVKEEARLKRERVKKRAKKPG